MLFNLRNRLEGPRMLDSDYTKEQHVAGS